MIASAQESRCICGVVSHEDNSTMITPVTLSSTLSSTAAEALCSLPAGTWRLPWENVVSRRGGPALTECTDTRAHVATSTVRRLILKFPSCPRMQLRSTAASRRPSWWAVSTCVSPARPGRFCGLRMQWVCRAVWIHRAFTAALNINKPSVRSPRPPFPLFVVIAGLDQTFFNDAAFETLPPASLNFYGCDNNMRPFFPVLPR